MLTWNHVQHTCSICRFSWTKAPKKETQDILDVLKKRRDTLVNILNNIEGIDAHMPEAGFMFPKITHLLKIQDSMM